MHVAAPRFGRKLSPAESFLSHGGAAGGSGVVDRACPPSSTCVGGHCQPPPVAAVCHKAADCSGGTVCTLFVVNGTVGTYCAPPLPGANECPGGNNCHPVAPPSLVEGAPLSGLSVCAM